MAQHSTFSALRAGRETSFLSFDDAPNSPNPQALGDSSQSFSPNLNGSPQHSSASHDRSFPGAASNSTRASPSKASRFLRSRPSSSKDLAADAGQASNPGESTSPTRTGAKSASRGSRLGALLGRTLPQNDASHARNASLSSTNYTEGPSSDDSGFFARRARKVFTANEDAAEPIQTSDNTAMLAPGESRQETARAASALGMLDFKPDPAGQADRGEMSVANGRSARPSSQNILMGPSTSSADAPATTSAGTGQSRVGRLGRLAYKKDDSIAFIAQSRNASQRMTAGTRSSSLQGSDHVSQQAGELSNGAASTRGLGIDDGSGQYAQGMHDRRYEEADQQGGFDGGLGVASSRADNAATASSSNASSRAPSATGSHAANYHNRFSRQGLSQELILDSSHELESRAAAHAPSEPTHSSRTSYERTNDSPRGTLSDAAIAALGAMPGASAGSLLNASGAPLSSKNILTIALQKAQSAVQLDSANNVPDAIAAYKQAVRLLEEVMERIAPRNGKRSRPSREEERRRLKVIHDTYADRIRLLSMIYSPDPDDGGRDMDYGGNQQIGSSKADWLDRVRDDSQEESAVTPRMREENLDEGVQRSPREDSKSFLSMTPVATAFQATSPQPDTGSTSAAPIRHPFPKSPPMQNRPLSPLSPTFNTSPRRRLREHGRPGSRDSHGSRASVSLSIADEQEAQDYRLPPPVIAEEMPRISVEGTGTSVGGKRLSSPTKKERLSQIRGEQVAQQHVRSESDDSYKSSTARLKPSSHLPQRVFGLDDEVRTPSTPYFDATGEVGTATDNARSAEPAVRQRNLSMTSAPKTPLEAVATERAAEKPVKMNLAQRARALSFKGPLLRQKASMPSLGDRKRDDAGDAAANVPALPTRRPGSADSTSLEPHKDHPTPWDLEHSSTTAVRPASNRPRASTASALVSASTSAGTISQRRKNDRAVQGLSDELAELGMMEDAAHKTTMTSSTSRQRSSSQPGSRRPSIPAAFVAANAGASGGTLPATLSDEKLPPPVPNLARTLSALELKKAGEGQTTFGRGAAGVDASFATSVAGDVSVSSLAMPLPRPLVNDELNNATTMTTKDFLITDIFPSGLPSLAAGAPSYASANVRSLAPLPSLPAAPTHALLKPFGIMDQLRQSIISGAHITERLYLSRAAWRQAGVKLVSVETKVRAIEVLLAGLDTVDKVGEALLMPLGSGAGLETSNASRFVKCLDEWESVLVEVQGTLSRKLPFLEGVKDGNVGAAGGGTGKSKFASRFTRGLDRMTGGGGQAKTVDSSSIGAYVDALMRLFGRAGVLGKHIKWLLIADGFGAPLSPTTPKTALSFGDTPVPSPTTAVGTAHSNRTAYSALPPALRGVLQNKLGKSSEFFGKVVLAWVLQDVSVLLERGVAAGGGGGKRGSAGASGLFD
ncbi:MIT domain-containing protein [Pseudozyma hubeiensis]|nr:MIT domain-containing protein [Pseudozyma hubeiensis]